MSQRDCHSHIRPHCLQREPIRNRVCWFVVSCWLLLRFTLELIPDVSGISSGIHRTSDVMCEECKTALKHAGCRQISRTKLLHLKMCCLIAGTVINPNIHSMYMVHSATGRGWGGVLTAFSSNRFQSTTPNMVCLFFVDQLMIAFSVSATLLLFPNTPVYLITAPNVCDRLYFTSCTYTNVKLVLR